MKNLKKDNLIWFILWAILFAVFVFFLGFIVGRAFPLKFNTSFSSMTHSDRYFPIEIGSETCIQEEHGVSEQSMVADPLYGAELYRFYISQINEQYYPDVDPYIALAVLEIESNYKPNLTSSAGAVGLMQWIPKWHAWRMEKFHLNDMWDPYTNIIVGMDYLNDLYSLTGSWRDALYGYNHSAAYVNSVLSRADLLREGGYFG